MVSIVDVSKRAGVSIATVSRALSDPGKLRPATLERVKEAVAATGYRPSSLGKNLRVGRSQSIMVLVPDLANAFFHRVIKGIEDRAAELGYRTLVGDMANDQKRAFEHGEFAARRTADGIVNLSGHVPANIADLVHKDMIPMVFGCEWDEDFSLPCVRIDNFDGAYRLGKYLLSLGHDKFGLVTGPKRNQHTILRSAGFKQALEECSAKTSIEFVIEGDYSSASGYQAIASIEPKRLPDAIFCFNDEMAFGAMRRLYEAGINVPSDVSIAGFDNLEASQFCIPSLTSVWQPAEEIGRRAMSLLNAKINGEGEIRDVILMTDLIIRESTARKSR